MDHRLETIEASVEQIQESQLYINQDLDYLEKSLEYFEDELAVARVNICELKQDTARQITINIFEQIEEMINIFKIVMQQIYIVYSCSIPNLDPMFSRVSLV
ncbi:hypothetical protein C2G38_2150411 [Gigaspora rosea]|uniref:Uncharacterized protein n=1 Tax=Gigaspora rosea TaxID=44941 RepID=A0A397U2B0_9GLOM|nr:hypothetical protein C2G38_2150411 [Gigaspora rosea]